MRLSSNNFSHNAGLQGDRQLEAQSIISFLFLSFTPKRFLHPAWEYGWKHGNMDGSMEPAEYISM